MRSFTPFFEAQGRIQLRTTGAYGVVLHGKVAGSGGEPLSGVTVTLRKKAAAPGGNDTSLVPVLVPAGYGSTLTRGDGAFDLALNGGSVLILDYSRPGYLPAQRGREDKLAVPRYGRLMSHEIPGARYLESEKGGHFVPLHQPDAFNDVLVAFLSRSS
jgi:hypothetical protein